MSSEPWPLGEAIPVADNSEIKAGKAVILSNIDGNCPEEYTVEISRLEFGSGSRNMTVTVTDKRLLDTTGGIVQGMSGSPIIQNGKIIGAVTHVLVNSPCKGYGISIENMLETAQELAA